MEAERNMMLFSRFTAHQKRRLRTFLLECKQSSGEAPDAMKYLWDFFDWLIQRCTLFPARYFVASGDNCPRDKQGTQPGCHFILCIPCRKLQCAQVANQVYGGWIWCCECADWCLYRPSRFMDSHGLFVVCKTLWGEPCSRVSHQGEAIIVHFYHHRVF